MAGGYGQPPAVTMTTFPHFLPLDRAPAHSRPDGRPTAWSNEPAGSKVQSGGDVGPGPGMRNRPGSNVVLGVIVSRVVVCSSFPVVRSVSLPWNEKRTPATSRKSLQTVSIVVGAGSTSGCRALRTRPLTMG